MDCDFCRKRIPAGTEYIYVTNKGKAIHFCSSKCHKNLIKLNRKPRDIKWTKTYMEEKEARLKILGKTSEAKPEPAAPAKAEKPAEAKPKAHEKAAKEAHAKDKPASEKAHAKEKAESPKKKEAKKAAKKS